MYCLFYDVVSAHMLCILERRIGKRITDWTRCRKRALSCILL